ncbi:MAG: alpha/beta hydrolase [Lachnospiraceae bacterium]|nr:alpha/beta hydrolase [Lachnospiraceae bacterium]
MSALKIACLAAGAVALGVAAETVYFYRRTMIRSHAKVERTMKMAGTDWSQYFDFIVGRKEYMLAQPHQDVYQTSKDGLKLHATFFPQGDKKKVAICFHGYTSQGMTDYTALSDYYLKHGFSMLLPDARAHGQSEGTYVGFGCLDRYDALGWIQWIIQECGEDVQILLHGTSMGGATVLMTGGLELPGQVKGIISDCAFTSPKEVFTHVLHSMYHLPAFPLIPLTDVLNRKLAGYGTDECNAAREAVKIRIPLLVIHGSADTFVPTAMCHEIYDNCQTKKRLLVVEGAAHAESYYKETKAYEEALDWMIEEVIK